MSVCAICRLWDLVCHIIVKIHLKYHRYSSSVYFQRVLWVGTTAVLFKSVPYRRHYNNQQYCYRTIFLFMTIHQCVNIYRILNKLNVKNTMHQTIWYIYEIIYLTAMTHSCCVQNIQKLESAVASGAMRCPNAFEQHDIIY